MRKLSNSWLHGQRSELLSLHCYVASTGASRVLYDFRYCQVSVRLCLALPWPLQYLKFPFWAALCSLSWHRLKPTACSQLPCPSLDTAWQAGRQSWLLGCMLSKYCASSRQAKLVLPHCRYVKDANLLAAYNSFSMCSIASIQHTLYVKVGEPGCC